MSLLPYDASHWPHTDECPCSDCAHDRAADASIVRDAAYVARCIAAGVVLVIILDLLIGGPGIGVMVGL